MVRAAVIGTGFIGTVHAESVLRAGGTLVGFLGSSPERARASAERFGVRVFASLEELLASDVDVVHVASPNRDHAAHARGALRAGKHVVCEKPLTTSLGDALELADLARERGLVAATCFSQRFYPLVHHARSLLAGAEVGQPKLVTGSYRQDWLLHPSDWNWRIDPAVGGPTRAVADIGSHLLDMLGFVLGARVESLYARLHTTVPVRQSPDGDVDVHTDDAAHLLVRWENGAQGSLTISQVSPGRKNELSWSIDGTDGAIDWSSRSPDELWIGRRDGPNQTLFRDPATLSDAASAITFYPGGHVEGFGETFRGLFEQVYAHIEAPSRAATYPTFDDGAEGLRLDEAIRTSASEDRWTRIER